MATQDKLGSKSGCHGNVLYVQCSVMAPLCMVHTVIVVFTQQHASVSHTIFNEVYAWSLTDKFNDIHVCTHKSK